MAATTPWPEAYKGQPRDKKPLVQVVNIKEQDIAVAIMGVGAEAGFKEFGRATNSFLSSRSSSGISTASLDGGDRGTVVNRGDILSFQYDNGEVSSATCKLEAGGGLVLNGSLYLRMWRCPSACVILPLNKHYHVCSIRASSWMIVCWVFTT